MNDGVVFGLATPDSNPNSIVHVRHSLSSEQPRYLSAALYFSVRYVTEVHVHLHNSGSMRLALLTLRLQLASIAVHTYFCPF